MDSTLNDPQAGLVADLVLEGGGVKGIAHIGAVTALESSGYKFQRVAGTSAGAVAAAVVACCAQRDKKVADIQDLMCPGKNKDSIQYKMVPSGRTTIPGLEQALAAMSVVVNDGFFDSTYLRDWIHGTLKREWDVEKFGDLRIQDPKTALATSQQYRLVVMVADVSRGSLVRLPWDYHLYGLDPDQQYVADAVRASASIPYFFEPAKLSWAPPSTNTSDLVDGGMLSDFPIEIFDRDDRDQSRWPTFGVKLSAEPDPTALAHHIGGPISLGRALYDTALNGNDAVHLSDPCVLRRTMFIDTSFVSATDFGLDDNEQQQLFNAGQQVATAFVKAFDWNSFKVACGADLEARRFRALAARGASPIDLQGDLEAPVAAGS